MGVGWSAGIFSTAATEHLAFSQKLDMCLQPNNSLKIHSLSHLNNAFSIAIMLLADNRNALFIYLTPFNYSNPIPFIPFPLIRGRGISYIREASPLFDSPFKERGDFLLRGANAPLKHPNSAESSHLER
jgi:hypothetical protein